MKKKNAQEDYSVMEEDFRIFAGKFLEEVGLVILKVQDLASEKKWRIY